MGSAEARLRERRFCFWLCLKPTDPQKGVLTPTLAKRRQQTIPFERSAGMCGKVFGTQRANSVLWRGQMAEQNHETLFALPFLRHMRICTVARLAHIAEFACCL
ncbi:hypothetical protein TRVL_09708 [Trypanosoma vivax]|nr:hypothetical protein TRVL_09708 [Trypanosoma vivax]